MGTAASQKDRIKFDAYTEELLLKIKNEKITVDPVVWNVMNHVFGNRLYAIFLNLDDYIHNPPWILKTGSLIMSFLYKISGNGGKMYPITYCLQRALSNAQQMKDFLKCLREATEGKSEF